MIFTRQLATLIDSGLPLLRGLNVLAKQERDSVLKNTINKLAPIRFKAEALSQKVSLNTQSSLTIFTSTW